MKTFPAAGKMKAAIQRFYQSARCQQEPSNDHFSFAVSNKQLVVVRYHVFSLFGSF